MTEQRSDEGSERKEQLLAKVVDHVLENGISGLTLRGLAVAVGSNNRMLLYYFGSREELIVAALTAAEGRFPGMGELVGVIDDRVALLPERLVASWATISDPANLPFHRLFFEIFGMAGFQRDRFSALLGAIGTEWVEHVADAFANDGVPPAEALAFAHELVALWRGLQAALISGGDPVVIDSAAREATISLIDRAHRIRSC